jgi:ribonuclease Y
MTEVLVGIAALVIGIGIGFLVRKAIATSQVHSAEARAQKVVLDAQVEAKTVMKQSLVDGNEQIAALRREAEEDIRARREEIQRQERRVGDKEESLDGKLSDLERRSEEMDDRDRTLQHVREELERQAEGHKQRLEAVAGMTSQEAREALMGQMVDDAKRHSMAKVRELEQLARE